VRLTELSFDEWVEHAFGHETPFRRNAWFFDADSDRWDPKPMQAVTYLTRLFEEPEQPLQWFTDAQIAQGLTYLVSTSASGDNRWLCSRDVPTNERIRCVEGVGSLFEKLFAPRCTPHLSHLSEMSTSPLNRVCYMWWDEFPSIALVDDPDLRMLHDSALRTMERILLLSSLACQESALHGLGHWQHAYKAEVETIIDSFLSGTCGLDTRLRTYAAAARWGCVL
jgi:hypothetical protein